MQLQTIVPLAAEKYNPITYNSKIVSLGSCFAEYMGSKLDYYKFSILQNPLGILFHPKAIEKLITKAVNKEAFTEDEAFFLNERWHCFDAHSIMSSIKKEALLRSLNNALKTIYDELQNATHIIITLGTAWVYRYIETDTIVANCHKVPQKKFLKELLSVDEVTESIENSITLTKSINPNITFIFTISPVRHLKDGFIENQRSKSHLLAGIHKCVEERKQKHYFPSYEIQMDELRDYRFYAEDMLHPNQIAIQYIWEKFKNAWISIKDHTIMEEIKSIQRGLAHKPFNPNSEEHQQFLERLQQKIERLQKKLPHTKF